jgi:histidinol-phosphate aminotransferase
LKSIQQESGMDHIRCSSEVTRRNFMRLAGVGAASAAVLPAFAQNGMQMGGGQQGGRQRGDRPQMSPDAVRISLNENPMGPAESAIAAILAAAPTGGRYDRMGVAPGVIKTFSDQFGLKPGYVELYPGSGGPLDMALMSNISPTRGLVCADPSYEQGPRAA